MGPVGCVPSNFGHHGDQVYLALQPLQLAVVFFAGHYAKLTDLLAKCLREKETRVGKEMGETWVDQ